MIFCRPEIRPNKPIGEWDGETWELVKTWRGEVKSQGKRIIIEISKGFETDFRSGPKFYRARVSKMGLGLIAWLVHDGLYAAEYFTRSFNDRVMLDILDFSGISWSKRNTCWLCVRVGGWTAYAKNTEESIAKAIGFVKIEIINEN